MISVTQSAKTTTALISLLEGIQAAGFGSRAWEQLAFWQGCSWAAPPLRLRSQTASARAQGKAAGKHGRELIAAEHDQSGILKSTKTSPKHG